MTDHVPEIHPTAAPPAPAAGTATPAPAAAAPLPAAGDANTPASAHAEADVRSERPANTDAEAGAADAHAPRPAGSGKRRGGRNRRKPGSPDATEAQPHAPKAQPQADAAGRLPRAPRPIPPALEKLAELYPQLFGAVFRPLKRGIFQDLLAAHPDDFEREALKVALGIHTRSTRYLQSVAAGQQRHDLQGQPVEAMAPEHVHQALLEVHRRRQGRNSHNEDLLPKLRARIVANIEASGLSREDYAERVRPRDEAANALLDEALAEMAAKTAREEALVRAFDASGKTVEAFADMYGMDPRSVARSLHSARARAAAAAAAAEQEASREDAAPVETAPTAAAVPASAQPVARSVAEPAEPAAPAMARRRPWCLRTRMTMTPSAPRLGRWS